jgi:hypothetical protein
MTTKIYQSDGSDGYSAGMWGYVLTDSRGSWFDGGFASEEQARDAAQEKETVLTSDEE